MPVNENPDNDPVPEHIKKMLDDIKSAGAKKPSSPKKKTASKKKSAKKRTSKKQSVKKPIKKAKPVKPMDIGKLLNILEEDPQLIAYKKNTKAIAAKLYEHLNCFIVIGYTEQGDPVQITSAKCSKDYDALSTALQKYVLELLPKGPPGNSF